MAKIVQQGLAAISGSPRSATQNISIIFVDISLRTSHTTRRETFSIQPGVRDIFWILKTPPIEEDTIETARQAPDGISALIYLDIFSDYY